METTLARFAEQAASPYFALAIGLGDIPPVRRLDFVEVSALFDGAGVLTLHTGAGDLELPLTAGTMFLFRPRDTVSVRSTAGILRLVVVTFPADDWAAFAATVGLDGRWDRPVVPPSATFDPNSAAQTRFLLSALERYEAGATLLDRGRFWMSVVPRFFPARRDSEDALSAPGWLADAVTAMRQEENLREGVRRLVQLAHVSAPHLSTSVKRYYHTTPTELVTRMRLRHAALLLRATPDAVAEVARRSGYRNPAHFSTRFRREFRMSPRTYRTRWLHEQGADLPLDAAEL